MIKFKNPNHYSHSIFDFDGVLYNTRLANKKAYDFSFKKFNINLDSNTLNKIDGRSWDQFLKASQLDLKEDTAQLIKNQKALSYPQFFQFIERNDSLFTYIKDLKAQSKKISIASSASSVNIINVLHHFNDYDFFDIIISRDDIKNPKPDPEIFHKCLDSMAVNAHDCIVFEDSDDGIKAAKAAGIKTLRVDTFEYERNK